IGGLVGIGLAYPISELFIFIGDFNYCTAHIVSWTIFASLGITLAAAEGSMCLFIIVAALRKKKAKKIAAQNKALAEKLSAEKLAAEQSGETAPAENEQKAIAKDKAAKKAKAINTSKDNSSIKWVIIVIGILALIFTGVSIIDNEMLKKITSIEALFSLLVVTFIGTKYLFPKIAHSLSRLKKLPVTLRYAIKNASKVDSLANTASVIALLLVILGAIALVLAYAIKSVEHDTTYLAGDYMVQNITDAGLEDLRKSEDIEAIYGVFTDYGTTSKKESYRYTIISTSDVKGFAPHLDINTLPTGNEAYMCKEIAMATNLNIGDEFDMTISGVEDIFVYAGNVKLGGSTVVINYEDMGLSPTFYEVIGKEGMSGEEIKQSIVSAMTFETAVVVPATVVTKRLVDAASRYITCIEFISMFLVIFSLIGIIDSIASSYRSRRGEFACYMSAGMNKKKIKRLKACEISFAITFAFVFAMLIYMIVFGDLYEVIRSFTENMFYVF
ncbi:MAG: hypothetical protein MJ193_01970, partial [Clostridia bacterium]|nr:hypothetical protein [Clostridia bacterium]